MTRYGSRKNFHHKNIMAKSTKKKSKISSGGDNAFQQFLLWHGEKIVVGIVVVVALWFAMKGLGGYQPLKWPPGDLERVASEAETAIRNNVRTAEDEEIQIFDYATFAEQIRVPISATPYRSESAWLPVLGSSRPSSAPSE